MSEILQLRSAKINKVKFTLRPPYSHAEISNARDSQVAKGIQSVRVLAPLQVCTGVKKSMSFVISMASLLHLQANDPPNDLHFYLPETFDKKENYLRVVQQYLCDPDDDVAHDMQFWIKVEVPSV